MDLDALNRIATAMVASGKGILAADNRDARRAWFRGHVPTQPVDELADIKNDNAISRLG
jgi:hypothetical protein